MRASPRSKPGSGKTSILPALVLLAAVSLLAGCSSFRTEWGQSLKTEPEHFTEGRTRVETVVHELGPPAQASALPGGFVFLYEHSAVKEFQIGFSIDVGFLRYIKFIRAWNTLDQDLLLLVFDDEGVLRSMDPELWRERLGGGGAAQFLFSVISLTDDSVLRQRSPQHYWGRDDLQPVPVLMNSAQSLRSGQNGLQLRLAQTYAGQHALEMAKPKKKQKKSKSQSSPR